MDCSNAHVLSTRRVFAVLAVAVLAVLCALAVPQPRAYAKSYTCDSIDIEAIVTDDGSLAVAETRTLDFDGSFSLYGMILDPPDDGELQVAGVTVQGSDGAMHQLEPVQFQKEWRTSGGPGNGYYAVDEPRDTVYCFSRYRDDVYSVTVAYSYTNAVLVHQDVAELYWQFVGTEWEVDPGDATLNLTLPVLAGEQVVGGENVRAWGHGALDGTVRFADDGKVVFSAPHTSAGSFVEARVAFPKDWVPRASADVTDAKEMLPTILSEEQEWADKANRDRIVARAISFGPGGISLAALVMCIVMFFRHGREHEPTFTGDYWRDVPEPGMPPAFVGRVTRWNSEDVKDFTATLMDLSARGIVRMEKATEERTRMLGLGTKTVDDYVLVQTHSNTESMTDLERRAYSLVFDKVGHGAEAVSMEDIRRYAEDNPESFVDSMGRWQAKLSQIVDKAGVFEVEGEKWSKVFKAVPAAFVGIGVVVWLSFDNWVPLAAMAVPSIIMFAMSGKIRRRSQAAADINARSEGLKRWFKDFTNLQEAVPTDTKVWGQLLVYAYLFGVAKDVVEKLRVRVPQLWEDDAFSYYTYWYWMPHEATSFGDELHTAVDSSLSTARSALSSDSDGGGGGGGFSGGGGGGFGGGGGGFAR